MTRVRPIILSLLLVAFVCVGAMAEDYDSLPYLVSWDPVEGAGGYLVEARKPGGPVTFRETIEPDAPRVTLSLPAGEYEIRITTLDRLMNPDSSTKWMSIEILPDAAPKVLWHKSARYILGFAIGIPLSASQMGEWTEAYLVSPSGNRLRLTVRKKGKNSFTLSGIVAGEPGPYKLVLKNSETRLTEIPAAAIMQYPDMTVLGVSPEKSFQSSIPLELTVSGRQFSPEANFAIRMVPSTSTVADKNNSPMDPMPLEIVSATEDTILCRTPIALVAGLYELVSSNNAGVRQKPVAQFSVEPIAVAKETEPAKEPPPAKQPPPAKVPPPAKQPPPAKEPPPAKQPPPASNFARDAAVDINLGVNIDLRPDAWGEIYKSPSISGFLSADAFLIGDPRPENGLSASFLTGIRCDVQFLSNDGSSGYYRSSILGVMANVCPGFAIALPRVRVKFYAGAGAYWSNLEWRQTELSSPKTASSIDISAVAGLTAEYSIARWISVGIAGQFAYVFMTTPSSICTASAFMSTTLPLK